MQMEKAVDYVACFETGDKYYQISDLPKGMSVEIFQTHDQWQNKYTVLRQNNIMLGAKALINNFADIIVFNWLLFCCIFHFHFEQDN